MSLALESMVLNSLNLTAPKEVKMGVATGQEFTIYNKHTGQTLYVDRIENGFKVKIGSMSVDLMDDGSINTNDCELFIAKQ